MSDELDHHLGEDLAAMADGGRELPADKKLELERHVEGCAECRAALATARLILRTVDETKPVEPSPSFDAAMFAKLDALDRRSFFERVRAWFTPPRLSLAGAACAVAIAALLLVDRTPDPKITAEAAAQLEDLVVAEDLELYQDLAVVEDLDVLEDLDAIEDLGEPG